MLSHFRLLRVCFVVPRSPRNELLQLYDRDEGQRRSLFVPLQIVGERFHHRSRRSVKEHIGRYRFHIVDSHKHV